MGGGEGVEGGEAPKAKIGPRIGPKLSKHSQRLSEGFFGV